MFGVRKSTASVKGRIGLAFGRDHVALAVVAGGPGNPVLVRCELVAVDPAEGSEGWLRAILGAKLPRLPVSTVLQPEDYQLALVEAPKVPRAELRAAIRWCIKDSVDVSVDDATIDFFEVPATSRAAQARMMHVVVAQRSAVERHVSMLAGTGMLEVIDVPELCLRNLAATLTPAHNAVALLYLGEGHATMVLVQGRTFYFARQFDLQAAHGEPATADGAIDVSAIVLELQRSLDYYERHFDQPPITRVAIAPAGRRAEQLAAQLAQETGFKVEALDLNVVLRCAAPVPVATQSGCLLAVAAALREERRSL